MFAPGEDHQRSNESVPRRTRRPRVDSLDTRVEFTYYALVTICHVMRQLHVFAVVLDDQDYSRRLPPGTASAE